MGDRAALTVKVALCAEDKRADAFAAVSEYTFARDWSDELGEELELGATYTHDEISIGAVDELADQLIALDAAFIAWQGGRYENPGWTIVHVPGVGTMSMASDEAENAYVSVEALDELVDRCRDDMVALRDELRRLTNADVREAWSTIESALEPIDA